MWRTEQTSNRKRFRLRHRITQENFMRLLFGMILGIVLTLGVAFVHDTWSTGPSTTGSSATVASRNMVNWDVVDANWQRLRQRAQDGWDALSRKITS
jgi:hypothetical protein